MARKSTRSEPVAEGGVHLADVTALDSGAIEEHLKTLGVKIADLVSDTDRLLADHPKAAIISAFLLGVAVGRASKR